MYLQIIQHSTLKDQSKRLQTSTLIGRVVMNAEPIKCVQYGVITEQGAIVALWVMSREHEKITTWWVGRFELENRVSGVKSWKHICLHSLDRGAKFCQRYLDLGIFFAEFWEFFLGFFFWIFPQSVEFYFFYLFAPRFGHATRMFAVFSQTVSWYKIWIQVHYFWTSRLAERRVCQSCISGH